MLSWVLITASIAVDVRLPLYWYIKKIAGKGTVLLYNILNCIVFTVIAGAMITASVSAVRILFNIPVQLNWYPQNVYFVIVALVLGMVVVLITIFGFKAVASLGTLSGPWLFTMFIVGGLISLPLLASKVLGITEVFSIKDFLAIGHKAVWTGINSQGKPGIGIMEVIGLAWSANVAVHFGLVDMAVLRYAKKSWYGAYSGCGMFFGHFLAWIATGIMGTAAAIMVSRPLSSMDPGSVAFNIFGYIGLLVLFIAGWTTANASLYRAGLAAEGIFPKISRKKVTFAVGVLVAIIACFPFVFTKCFPLLTYSGVILVPIGGVVFAEHWIFPKIGLTRYWAYYRNLVTNYAAVITWIVALVFAFLMVSLGIISYVYVFVFEWALSIIVYIILSKFFKADEKFPEEEKKDLLVQKIIKVVQDEEAEKNCVKTDAAGNKVALIVLHVISKLCLLLLLIGALYIFCNTIDIKLYAGHLASFKVFAGIVSIIYLIVGIAIQYLQNKKN